MKQTMNYSSYVSLIIGSVCLLIIAACKKKEELSPQVSLQIDSYYPNSGKGGTLVTILGDGFSTVRSENTVSFAGQQAEVLTAKTTELVVRAPENGSSGTISMSRGSYTMEVGEYTYQSLSVQGIAPERAQEGAQVRISGEGFGSLAGPAVVTFNGVEANLIGAVDTLLVVEVPAGAGTGPVEVAVDGMQATGPVFYFMAINGVKPLTGGSGTRVTIDGSGFSTMVASNTVTFDGKPAEVVEATEERLVVFAPEGVETGRILVTVDGEAIIGPDFTVVPPPAINLVTPLSGPAGTEMVIKGETFSPEEGETHVFINEVEVELQSVSATEIKLVLPGGTGSGKVKVVVNDQATEGPDFHDQNLGVLGVSPDNGLTGTEVTIDGTGFSSNLTDNVVTFNGVQATVTAVTENSLTVLAPDGLSTGRIKVSVAGLEALAPYDFIRAGVVTLAGQQNGLSISQAGGSLAVDGQGNVYVVEVDNLRIMKVTPEGQVSLLAGSGSQGAADGVGVAASFRFTVNTGIVVDAEQNVFVTDPGNQALRGIRPNGEVVTIVPNFDFAIGKLTMHENGDLYVPRTTASSGMVIISLANGTVGNISGGGSAASYIRPAIDGNGNVYYVYNSTTSYRNRVYRYLATGGSGIYAGSSVAGLVDATGTAARFNSVQGIARLDSETLAVIDAGNYAIRKINTTNAAISTLAQFESGFQDGDFRTAKFSDALWDIAVSSDGNTVYVLDCGNNAVRKIYLR